MKKRIILPSKTETVSQKVICRRHYGFTPKPLEVFIVMLKKKKKKEFIFKTSKYPVSIQISNYKFLFFFFFGSLLESVFNETHTLQLPDVIFEPL